MNKTVITSGMIAIWKRVICLLLLMQIVSSHGFRGPPKVHHMNHLVTAEEGHAVKLPCPITANPEPLFEWTKNGRTVDDTWPRYVIRRHFLRIKSAREEDAGEFMCTGVNGFGQESFTFSLLIYRENLPPVSARREPVFTEVSPSTPFMTNIGDILTLVCKADGIPHPKITWKKDGESLQRSGSKLHRNIQSILDSGIYTCLATNPSAIKSHDFTIVVDGKTYEEPEIVGAKNASVIQGTNATLQCIVKSFLAPEIQWLKLITLSEAASLPKHSSNGTLHRNGQTYRYISSLASRVERVNDSFVSTLFIQSASSSHAGIYICVGATRKGYNYREVHLAITSKALINLEERDKKFQTTLSDSTNGISPSQSLFLIILVPITALIMIISLAILICTMRRRHANLRKSHPSGAPNPSLENDEQKLGTPLHSFLPNKGLHNLPPDLVFQDGSTYTTRLTNMGPMTECMQYDDSYFYPENTYLDPNYSDLYSEPQDFTQLTGPEKELEARNSDHSYAQLTHSTRSSTSPLPPPPYGYPLQFQTPTKQHQFGIPTPFSYIPPQTHRKTKYVVHYNI